MTHLLITIAYLIQWVRGNDLNWFEIPACLAAAALAIWRPKAVPPAVSPPLPPRRAVLLVFLLALLPRAAMLPFRPIPQSGITDEFSHLLLSDTLAHGRLSNPPHPLWRHFETIHVIPSPAYSSMYLPGQALFLALGRAVAGIPWLGVWLSTALACAALCWMLQAWLPPRWALLGGILAAARFALASYWMDSYWGGSAAALGGALVLGAAGRLRRKPRIGAGIALGAGASLLAITRPFEGGVLCVPVAAAIAIWAWRARLRSVSQRWWRPLGAAAVLLALTFAGVMLLSYRVTGDPFLLPYQRNQQIYGWPMTLAWQKPRTVDFRHKELREYYEWELGDHRRLTSWSGWPDQTIQKAQFVWSFFLGPALSAPLLFLPLALRNPRLRLLAWAGAAVLAALLVEQTAYPHYAAPATAAFLALWLQCFRHLRAWRRPKGLALARLLPVVLGATLLLRAAEGPLGFHTRTTANSLSWCCSEPGILKRAEIQKRLEQTPGKHLVIVRYGPHHNFWREWVYNAADIDGSKIVWARDMGEENAELLRYFSARQVWMVTVEE